MTRPASVKQNRQTTYESLVAVVRLLFADNKDEFVAAYETATHSPAGDGCWYYVNRNNSKIQSAYHKRIKNGQQKKRTT